MSPSGNGGNALRAGHDVSTLSGAAGVGEGGGGEDAAHAPALQKRGLFGQEHPYLLG